MANTAATLKNVYDIGSRAFLFILAFLTTYGTFYDWIQLLKPNTFSKMPSIEKVNRSGFKPGATGW